MLHRDVWRDEGVCVCVHDCLSEYVYVWVWICLFLCSVSLCACLCMCAYVCLYACVCVYMFLCVCMQMWGQIQTSEKVLVLLSARSPIMESSCLVLSWCCVLLRACLVINRFRDARMKITWHPRESPSAGFHIWGDIFKAGREGPSRAGVDGWHWEQAL